MTSPWYLINKQLLPIKLWYFFFYAGTSSISPFVPHLLQQKGFSPVDVTTILGVVPFIAMVTKPAIGHLADYTRKYKPIVLCTLTIGLVVLSLLMLVPTIEHVTSVTASVRNEHEESHQNRRIIKQFPNLCSVTKINGLISTNFSSRSARDWQVALNSDALNRSRRTVEPTWSFLSCKLKCSLASNNTTAVLLYTIECPNQNNFSIENQDCDWTEVTECKDGMTNCQLSCNVTTHVTISNTYVIEGRANKEVVNTGAAYKNHFGHPVFWIAFVIIVVANSVGLAPSYMTVDTLTLALLKDNPGNFGKQRMYRSFGLAIAVIVVALAMDALPGDHPGMVNYKPSFIGFIVFLVATIICTAFVRVDEELQEEPPGAQAPPDFDEQRQPMKPVENTDVHSDDSSNETNSIVPDCQKRVGLRTFLPVLMQIRVLLFCFVTFVSGMNYGKAFWLNIWYLKSLGAPQITISIIVLICCVSAAITSFFSGKLIKCVGYEWTACMVLLAYTLRALLWSFITHPWHSAPIEILLGFCMGVGVANMGSYANKIAPKGSEASAQAVFSALYRGIGLGAGHLVSGWLYQKYNGINTWRVFGVGTFLVTLGYGILLFVLRGRYLLPDNNQMKQDSNTSIHNHVEKGASSNRLLSA